MGVASAAAAAVVAAIVINVGGLLVLAVATYVSYRRRQHRIVTYVRTTRALWEMLQLGPESGGLPNDKRAKIYAAADEQWDKIRGELASAHWLMDALNEEGDS